MTKEVNMDMTRFNPDYPGFIVPEVYYKTQLEIIEMGEVNGRFLTRTAETDREGREGPQNQRGEL